MLTCYVSKELVGEKKNLNGQVVRELGKFIKVVAADNRFATTGGKMQQNSTSFREAIDFVKKDLYFFIIETQRLGFFLVFRV
jgi:alanyl-tRNA synthetase